MVLTEKDLSTIHRAIGIIEGISFGTSGDVASGLITAVEMIDEVLDRKDGDRDAVD